MRSLRPSLIALSLFTLAIPAVAHAGDDETDAKAPLAAGCEGWFCDDGKGEPKETPAPAPEKSADGGDVASAVGKDGSIILPGGIEIPGRILEMIPGDHVTLQLGDGTKQSIPWLAVAGIRISAKIVIGGSTTTTTSAPPPPPATTAPPVVITPSAPPPPAARAPRYVDAPRPRPIRHEKPFESAFTLGGRFSLVAPGDAMGAMIGTGAAVEVQAGYRFSKSWRLYGALERTSFEAGRGTGASQGGSATFIGAGLELNLSPSGPIGYLIDVAMGFRSLDVPYATNSGWGSGTTTATYSGFEPLRLTAGITFPVTRGLRLDLLAFADFGRLSEVKVDGVTCSTGSYDSQTTCGTSSVSAQVQQSYETVGLAIGGHFEL